MDLKLIKTKRKQGNGVDAVTEKEVSTDPMKAFHYFNMYWWHQHTFWLSKV